MKIGYYIRPLDRSSWAPSKPMVRAWTFFIAPTLAAALSLGYSSFRSGDIDARVVLHQPGAVQMSPVWVLEVSSIYSQPAGGYVAWFKADGITGLNDGDPVGTWTDSSPNGKHATQSTGSFRPSYKTNIIAGKPVVRFDGTDDRLVSPGQYNIWGLNNDFTVFAVVWLDPNQGTGGHDVVGSSAIANNLDLAARRSDASSNWLAYSSSQDGARNSDLVLSTGEWHVLTWRLKATSPKHLQIRADTVYQLNDTGYSGIGTAPSQAAIGGRQNGANPFKGDIAEVIFYSASLTNADMQATEHYLREKYGLAEIPPAPPSAPTELMATPIDHQKIDLSWTDNATDEEGFRVERRLGQSGTFEVVGTVGTDITIFTDVSLLAETEYCYRTGAFKAGGDSSPSNVACASTAAAPPGPGPSGEPAPGYSVWFKTDAIIGLNDGDPVNTWEDSGPGNKDATQPTPSSQPVYKTSVVAGRPVVRFDGVDDRLVSAGESGIWGLSNDFTVLAVVWLDSAQGAGGHDVVGSSAIANNLDLIARRDDASGNWLAYSSSQDGPRNSDLVLSPGEWHVLTWRLKATSPKHLQIRADTIYHLNDAGYSGIGTAPSQAAIGARENGINPFKGDIAEVIFYSGNLSDAGMTATEDYLRQKYGLAPPPFPDPPTGLQTFPDGYYQISLSWEDNSLNESGFRIERREGQAGPWIELANVGPNTSLYVDYDPPLLPGTEYCYKVAAVGIEGSSSYSNESCSTTLPLVSMSCSPDEGEIARTQLVNILTDPTQVDWLTDVGLANVDPNQLQLVGQDEICQQLWSSITSRPPLEGFRATFFQLGDRYIVTEYVDPSDTPSIEGYNQTAVFDLQFILQDGVLQE